MAYDLYPAVDEEYNFPPEVRAALAVSEELKHNVLPMTEILRDNLTGAELWDGRLVLNTTQDRLNRYDLGTATWINVADLSDIDDSIDDFSIAIRPSLGMRNRVLNGGFRINQSLYVSGTTCAVGIYSFDQWKSMVVGSTMTFTDAVNGQLVTINSGGQFAQPMERANMPAGRYVVSHRGTAPGRMYNVGGTVPAFTTCPFVVDIDGLADVLVEFVADGGVTKTLGFVQVEQIGASGVIGDATPFELRPISLELLMCQRFFYRNYYGPNDSIAAGACYSATSQYFPIKHPNTMRASPTLSSTVDITFKVLSAGVQMDPVTFALSSLSEHGFEIVVSGTALGPAGNAAFLRANGTNTPCYLQASARL